MWYLGTWFSGGFCSPKLMVGLHDLKGLFLQDSMILSHMGINRIPGCPFQAFSGSINISEGFSTYRCLLQYQRRNLMGLSLKFSWHVPSHSCNCNMAIKYLIIALWLSVLINFWMLQNTNSNDTDFEKANNTVSFLVKRGLPNCCFHLTVMQLSIV